MNLKNQKNWYLLGVFLSMLLFGQGAVSVETVQAWQSSTETYAAFQKFENGCMIWREDKGEIYAFVRSPNVCFRFSEASNETLPDNTISENPPAELVKPNRGFGRVWGNYAYVRDQLGWEIQTEFGYTTVVTFVQGYPNFQSISLLDGDRVEFLRTVPGINILGTRCHRLQHQSRIRQALRFKNLNGGQ